ncbi:MAG: hydroxymethylbilane synthase [Syntrophomonas sp.]
MKSLRLGTRGSKLALWQAEHLTREINRLRPDLNVDLQVIKTTGDKILDVALSKIGDKGLFTKELENELLAGKIDAAVHSMKDLPSKLEPGLCIGAALKRENPGDVLISHKNYKFNKLPVAARIGTSSLRRAAQLKAARPDLVILDLRGNVETRIRKMQEENLDAIILAHAGVKRLGLENMISDYLPFEIVLPAVGQGVIAVEARENDGEVLKLLQLVDDRETHISSQAERAFLREFEGGCQVPAASLAQLHGDKILVRGLIASLDGQEVHMKQMEGPAEEAELIGQRVARSLLEAGADKILEDIKSL